MLKDKVQKIKEAEEKASHIIQKAESRASDIALSLDGKLTELKKEKEQELGEKAEAYRKKKQKEAALSIEEIERAFNEKTRILEQRMSKTLPLLANKVWEELRETLF